VEKRHLHIPNWTSNDGYQLGALKNDDASLTSSKNTQNLRRYANCRDKGLHHECGAGPKTLDHPTGDKEIDSAAKRCAHAQDGVLRCSSGGNLIPAAAVTGALIWRVVFIEHVTLHQVKSIKDTFERYR